MSVDRRQFLKVGLFATGAAATGTVGKLAASHAASRTTNGTLALSPDGQLVVVPGDTNRAHALPATSSEIHQGVPGRRWVMVIDLALCDGCGDCQDACAKMHFLPPGREWLRLYKLKDAPNTAPYWFPKGCYHCDNPPCTKVCPVGATFKRQDGIVLIDNDKCIGCRFCMAACPYSTRVFNWSHPKPSKEEQDRGDSAEWGTPRQVGTVEKCDFCAEEARAGRLPHCIIGCEAMGAMYFGDENEDAVTNGKGETVRLSELLRKRAGYRHLEELGTSPRVYYLPASNRRYPAPDEPETARADVKEH